MSTTTDAYREVFVVGEDDEHPNLQMGFYCSLCLRPVQEQPCPDHAPTDVPGLCLVDCDAQPRHRLWVYDAEDYGVPCYRCMADEQAARDAEARQCRHWPWRAWRVTRWAASWAYRLGITSGSAYTSGDGHNWCVTFHPRGRRPYILGASRDTWRCWLKGRHRRGEHVGFGFCGKCMPWPCCGAPTQAHEPGCREDV